MPAGFWGNTIQEFRPGFYNSYSNDQDIATIESRMNARFTAANRAFWLKQGTYCGARVKAKLAQFYTTSASRPSVPTDPDDPGYNWSYLDAVNNSSVWNTYTGGIIFFFATGASGENYYMPQWMVDAGFTWVNSNGVPQYRFDLAAARLEWLYFFQAMAARYASTRKFWAISIQETLLANSSAHPAGFSINNSNTGRALVGNMISDAFGGVITPAMESVNTTILASAYAGVGLSLPDPRPFLQNCPSCTNTTAQYAVQQVYDSRPVFVGFENNGMTQTSGPWPADNPLHPEGYTGLPTFEDVLYIYSSIGYAPAHVFYLPYNSSLPSTSNANVEIGLNNWAAGGSDLIPYLPTSYVTTPPSEGGDGAWEYGAVGTPSTSTAASLSPGLPVKAIGDLLVCVTANRVYSNACIEPSGWKIKGESGGLAVLMKYAEDTDTSSSSLDALVSYDFWEGTVNSHAFIFSLGGDVYTDLPTIVDAIATYSSGASDVAQAVTPALTPNTDGCIKLTLVRKRKSVASNGVNPTPQAGMANTILEVVSSGSSLWTAAYYTIDTTATALSASVITQDIAEDGGASTIVIALKVGGTPAQDTTAPTLHGTSIPTGTAASQTAIDWAWNDATDDDEVESYLLETATNASGPWSFLVEVTQADKTTDGGYQQTGLISATNYYLRYRAKDPTGNISAYSTVSAAVATDSPQDVAAPTAVGGGAYPGITSAVYDVDSGETTLIWPEAEDAVTATENIRYNIYAALSPASLSYAVPFDQRVGVLTVVYNDNDLTDGDWTFAVRPADVDGNENTNTVTVQETVGVSTVSGTIEPCELNSGTVQSGDAYLFIALQGDTMVINVTDPTQDGIPITYNSNGSVTVNGVAGVAGRYDWVILNSDGTSRGSGWVDLA